MPIIGLGIGPAFRKKSGLSLCAEYQTVYDSFITKPSDAKNIIYNTMVAALVAGGYWARMDQFNFHAAHTNSAGEALKNWKLPGTYDALAYLAPTFTADQGFLGNGTTQYIDYVMIPSTQGVNYVRDSCTQILYIRTDIASTTYHGIKNCADNKDCNIDPRSATNQSVIKTNDDTNVSNNAGDSLCGSGLFFNTRTAAAVNKLYRNKIPIVEATTASIGVPTHSFYSLAYNDDDEAKGFRADQVAIHILMDGCSQADVTAISDILNAAMTSLGTNIY